MYTQSIPKSIVERLVTAYNSKTTPEALKQEIIKNPVLAANTLNPVKFEKCNTIKKDISSRFDEAIRLVLKLVAETEAYLSGMADEEIQKHHRLLPIVCDSMRRFIKLAEYLVCLGKPRRPAGRSENTSMAGPAKKCRRRLMKWH